MISVPVLRNHSGVEDELAIVGLWTQPDQDESSILVDVAHEPNLMIPFIDGVLIDADCITPYFPTLALQAQLLQKLIQIGSN